LRQASLDSFDFEKPLFQTCPGRAFQIHVFLRASRAGAIPLLATLQSRQTGSDSGTAKSCAILFPRPPTNRMNRDLALADWLEELAIYGTPRRFQDSETAYHLSQAIRHSYIVRLAITHSPIGPRAVAPASVQMLSAELLPKVSDQESSHVVRAARQAPNRL